MQKILDDIIAELRNAQEKHPALPAFMLDPVADPLPSQFAEQASYTQKENDLAEKAGVHSWYGLDREEMSEKYSAKTVEELYSETIQCAALHVRFALALKAGKVKINLSGREL